MLSTQTVRTDHVATPILCFAFEPRSVFRDLVARRCPFVHRSHSSTSMQLGERKSATSLRGTQREPRTTRKCCADLVATKSAMNGHLADLDEILVREWPAGKLSDLAANRERFKIDADEADPPDRRSYLAGQAPSCCKREKRLATPQCSAILPLRTRMTSTVSN